MKILRRRFLIQALALPTVSVLFARFLAACGSNNSTSTAVTCNKGFTATSGAASDGDSHTHTVTVSLAQINGGTQQTIQTSTSAGHYHSVTFTAQDMTTLAADKAVTETTLSDVNAHTHTFAITCV